MILAAWAFMREGFRTAAQYRAEVLARMLQGPVYLVMWLSLWYAVYASPFRPAGAPPLVETLTYVLVVEFLATLLADDWILQEIFERLRSGDVALDLIRPVPLPLRLVAHQTGHASFFLLFTALPIYGLIALGMRLPMPTGLEVWTAFAGFALLAHLTRRLIEMCLGLTAFWITEAHGLSDILDFITVLFGGRIVPLWFYPPWLVSVAGYLPFRGIYFVPAAIFVGRLQPDAWGAAALVQFLWILTLGLLAHWLWRRAVTRVVVQGG